MRVADGKIQRLRIAARQSDLARLQAYRVGAALRDAHPQLNIEYTFRASLGDVNQTDPLWKMPEKGVFTEDFLKDLIEESADLVVHSWKDLPTEPREATEIVATLPRADVRDVLLFRRDRMASDVNQGRVRILTSSPRRAHNLGDFLKTHLPFEVTALSFENVRGNIPTRLKKLLAQDVEGLIVAKAALDRLLAAPEAEFAPVQAVIRDVLSQTNVMVLPLTVNPTAAAQGALAVEVKRGRPEIRELLNTINCERTFASVEKERAILASYGGGCHQKIGVNVLPRAYGDWLFLRGLTDRGEVLDRTQLSLHADLAGGDGVQSVQSKAKELPPFFDRESLPKSDWAWIENERFLWVARESAWPVDLVPRNDAVVWTAGIKTWRKLAERGVWVTGSAEGLGEDEPTGIETIADLKRAPDWIKLSHEGSAALNARPVERMMKLCATYRLRPRKDIPDLRGQTHFYWASASSFERAFELFPDVIRQGVHACGPGLTYKHIRRVLGPAARLRIEIRR